MRKCEIEMAAKECVEKCFDEDKMVMIDISIMRIKGIMFYIYDLIYFGNKIIISEDTLKKVKTNRFKMTNRILSSNCSYLLNSIEKDKHKNYQIVDLGNYGSTSIDRIENYLKEHEDVVLLLESQKFYQELVTRNLDDRLKLLDIRMKVISISKNEKVIFDTLGAIDHRSNSMVITKRQGTTLIKIYDSEGEEKKGNSVDVEVDDIIIIRSDKDIKYCYNLYLVITKHTRNQVIRIIWTDILKGERTNFYVKRLDEKYKKIIEDNVV